MIHIFHDTFTYTFVCINTYHTTFIDKLIPDTFSEEEEEEEEEEETSDAEDDVNYVEIEGLSATSSESEDEDFVDYPVKDRKIRFSRNPIRVRNLCKCKATAVFKVSLSRASKFHLSYRPDEWFCMLGEWFCMLGEWFCMLGEWFCWLGEWF